MADITKTVLLRLNANLENVWGQENTLANSVKPQTEAVKAILANQTAQFQNFDDWTKDRKLGINWVDPCGAEVRDCAPACTVQEEGLGTDMVEVEPNVCKEIGFSVNEDEMRTNHFNLENFYEVGMRTRIDALDEYLSAHVLAGLKAGAGRNLSPEPFTFNAAAMTTNVPAASYNLALIPEMINDSFMNKMGNVYFIDSGNLWSPYYMAKINEGNLDGKGNATLINQTRMYFDQFNFAKANLTESTFMLSQSAAALKTTNKFAPTIREIPQVGQTRYRVNSRNLEGVQYDVIYRVECVDSEIIHHWTIILRGFFALNPKGCPTSIIVGGTPTLVQSTGILSYTKTA